MRKTLINSALALFLGLILIACNKQSEELSEMDRQKIDSLVSDLQRTIMKRDTITATTIAASSIQLMHPTSASIRGIKPFQSFVKNSKWLKFNLKVSDVEGSESFVVITSKMNFESRQGKPPKNVKNAGEMLMIAEKKDGEWILSKMAYSTISQKSSPKKKKPVSKKK